jgi:hypothetical protein
MNPKEYIIITSISSPNAAMRMFAEGAQNRNLGFIVAGDIKSPADFSLPGCHFLSMENQLASDFQFARLCPTRHYARKNIAYLQAIRQGAGIIRDTDDDNLPRKEFWLPREQKQLVPTYKEKGWANVYRWFSDTTIWPRGLPLDEVQAAMPPLESLSKQEVNAPIQQGLADDNPDVDAVYRLLFSLPQSFEQKGSVALGVGVWCPFNSQNTTWHREAFPLLYLPAYCSFRMTDIWRSFVAQRIAWENGWSLLFHDATVWQERNEHSLMKDFEDEVPGYINNRAIAESLEELNLKSGADALAENLLTCYEVLSVKGWVGRDELPLLQAWLDDYSSLKR